MKFRPMPTSDELPYALYRAEQVREMDRIAIQTYGIPGEELMERAGQAAFALLRERWPDARRLLVVCGPGNNGGDGYVVARLALERGLDALLVQLGHTARIRGEAAIHRQRYLDVGGGEILDAGWPVDADVIVDAIFGTGLERPVSGHWADAIRRIDQANRPVLALDLPSGLHADTGAVLGVAVRAAATISFIGLKQGLFTGNAPDYVGEVFYHALEVPARLFASQVHAARRQDWKRQRGILPKRRRTAHKGDFGHVLVIGGNHGMGGAARLAGEAALRGGAGLVSLATRAGHAASVVAARPELMARGIDDASDLAPMLARASVLVLGPGLGDDEWAHALFDAAIAAGKPGVLDADGLNRLAGLATPPDLAGWVLTPHPGEAARLLGTTTREIQTDRFAALRALQARYPGATVVLKGAGSLVSAAAGKPPSVCTVGNPGMASGGMGDVLGGVIAALLAQHLPADEAAVAGVCAHGEAADRAAAEHGERGLLASDLYPRLRRLLNEDPPRR